MFSLLSTLPPLEVILSDAGPVCRVAPAHCIYGILRAVVTSACGVDGCQPLGSNIALVRVGPDQ